MAREQTTPAQLQELRREFAEIVEQLDDSIKRMNECEMPFALIHSKTVRNQRLPELWDWIATLEKDVKSQVKAFKAGIKSAAEKEVAKAAADPRKNKRTKR